MARAFRLLPPQTIVDAATEPVTSDWIDCSEFDFGRLVIIISGSASVQVQASPNPEDGDPHVVNLSTPFTATGMYEWTSPFRGARVDVPSNTGEVTVLFERIEE